MPFLFSQNVHGAGRFSGVIPVLEFLSFFRPGVGE
jgi:hypothetical protein